MRAKPKILVIDDDAVYLAILKAQLEDENYQVFSSTDPSLMLSLVESVAPDLILLDEQMPECTGLELLQQLKNESCTENIPVFIMSATDPDCREVRALDQGASDFINKFLDPRELTARLRNCLVTIKTSHETLPELSGYQIVELLGQGPSGEVHLAQDLKTNRTVAIKFFNENPTRDMHSLQSLQIETRLKASVPENGLIEVFDYGTNPRPYLVMAYIEGTSLEKRLKDQGPCSMQLVVQIGTRIANSLTYLHRKELLHLNLKPSSISLNQDDQAYIMNFGSTMLSYLTSADNPKPAREMVPYCAPEVFDKSFGEIDHRSDVYSLGCVLFQMATNRPPFSETDRGSLIKRILRESPPTPSSYRNDGDRRLDDLIMKCLSKAPEGRFQSTETLSTELSKLQV